MPVITRFRLGQLCRGLYVAVAFAGALSIYSCNGPNFAYAAEVDDSHVLLHDTQIAIINTRLDNLSDEVSMIRGGVAATLGLLGVLQVLGFIKDGKKEK